MVSIIRSLFFGALIGLCSFPSIAQASSYWIRTITPSGRGTNSSLWIHYGDEKTYTISVQNGNAQYSSTTDLGSVNFLVPVGYTLHNGVHSFKTTELRDWKVTIAPLNGRQLIKFRPVTVGDKLRPGESFAFQITPSMIEVRPAVGIYRWSNAASSSHEHVPGVDDFIPNELGHDPDQAWDYAYAFDPNILTEIRPKDIWQVFDFYDLDLDYTGSPLEPVHLNKHAFTAFTWTYSINGSVASPVNPGVYTLTISTTNSNYSPNSLTTPFTVLPSSNPLILGDLVQTYDGSVKSVTVSGYTGTPTVNIQYRQSGQLVAPVNSGIYDVRVEVGSWVKTGTLQIKPRNISIIADNQVKTLNAPMPPLTYHVEGDGLAAGDSLLGVSLSCSATQSSPVESYSITVTYTSGADPNYYVTSVQPGSLEIRYNLETEEGAGVQTPVKLDGSSTFKQGSTVPLKIKVLDANGVSIGTPGLITGLSMASCIPDGQAEVNQPVYSDLPDAAFRWDATDQQWIYNLKTKDLQSGMAYCFRVELSNGQFIELEFKLK